MLSLVIVMIFLLGGTVLMMVKSPDEIKNWVSSSTTVSKIKISPVKKLTDAWIAPDTTTIPEGEEGDLIRYGRNLISHTSIYLGPKGSVMNISNGMNCQNCHLDAGTKPFGNNYGAVSSTYPKFRPRSGTHESIEKRVNDCLERSLNGKSLDSLSHEMRAIVAYMHWLGKDVEKKKSPNGSGIINIPFLDRVASPENGRMVYEQKCLSCHGNTGEGVVSADGKSYTYPPLWGTNSYNIGAGLYRLSRFAGYVKSNMPLGAIYDAPQLTDEEAWDVAAYVNSMYRPSKDLRNDWPDISEKPIDHPFGPFTDGFDEGQHKLGPFKPIQEKREAIAKTGK
jgi:thiosulfate dehydrogenase